MYNDKNANEEGNNPLRVTRGFHEVLLTNHKSANFINYKKRVMASQPMNKDLSVTKCDNNSKNRILITFRVKGIYLFPSLSSY